MINLNNIKPKLSRGSLLLVAALTLISALCLPYKSLAIDFTFFNNSKILYYDPQACPPTEGDSDVTILTGNDNTEKVLRYYVGKGLALSQASGIAAAISLASGFNPATIELSDEEVGLAGDDYKLESGIGFGILQWSEKSDHDQLLALSRTKGLPLTDLSLQLDYSWHSLNGDKKKTLDELRSIYSPSEAAIAFVKSYSGIEDADDSVLEVWGNEADNIFYQYEGVVADGVTLGGSGACTTGGASAFVDGFTIYNQYDNRWAAAPYGQSTVGRAGCGPSAMAMIITALTGRQVTPPETAAYGAANGTLADEGRGGSMWNIDTVIGKRWGLESSNPGQNIAAINQALRSGGLIIMSGDGSAPFTTSGHFIVVRAVTAGGKWLIADSNGKQGLKNSQVEWAPEQIMSNNRGYTRILTR